MFLNCVASPSQAAWNPYIAYINMRLTCCARQMDCIICCGWFFRASSTIIYISQKHTLCSPHNLCSTLFLDIYRIPRGKFVWYFVIWYLHNSPSPSQWSILYSENNLAPQPNHFGGKHDRRRLHPRSLNQACIIYLELLECAFVIWIMRSFYLCAI